VIGAFLGSLVAVWMLVAAARLVASVIRRSHPPTS
jgi:hypothetical protein